MSRRDLERAGKGLSTRDVLGLVSSLKEDRNCKIVLLLNDERMDGCSRDEFNRQLEKVSDITLSFDLSVEEAVEIALPNAGPMVDRLRPRIIDLGILNIRVIKKIECLAYRLTSAIKNFDDITLDQSITTLALAGWSVQQPDIAPSLDFIRTYNRTAIAMRAGREESVDESVQRWRSLIQNYPYSRTDKFDAAIIDGASAGYFDNERLVATGKASESDRKQASGGSEFSRIWEELYHGSLATEDDDFLDALYRAAISEAKIITPLNINGAIEILRECGRNDQADKVITNYVEARSDEDIEFFNISGHHFFSDSPLDNGLRDAFAKRWAAYVDRRVPLEVLRSMGQRQGWDGADIAVMAKQSASDFERMFETLRGRELRLSIDILLAAGNSGATGSDTIGETAKEALRHIAAKSPLRKRKISRYNVDPSA